MEVMTVDEMKRLQITLRPEILEKLDVLALEMGLKRSAVPSLLIPNHLRMLPKFFKIPIWLLMSIVVVSWSWYSNANALWYCYYCVI